MTSQEAAPAPSGDRPLLELDAPNAPRQHWWENPSAAVVAMIALIELVAFLVVWQIAIADFELIHPVFIPPPSRIATGLVDVLQSGVLWPHIGISLVAWWIGYLLAAVVGVVLGIIIGASVPVNKLAKPVMWSLYAVPWLAYQPLSLAWFGFGLPPVIFIVFMASLFPILLNTAAGVGTTEPALLNVGRIFGASRASRYRKIVLPASLPFVFAGLRQSSVMATIALLVAEMKGPATGMGAFITFETNQLRVHNAFLGVVVLVLWTVIVSLVIGYIARRVAPWQSDARNS